MRSACLRAFCGLLSSLASLLAALSPFPAAWAAAPGPVSAVVPNHYLVVYREGRMPANPIAHIERAGARLTQRHERFGMASIVSTPEAVQHLKADLSIEYIIQDRIITGTAVLRPLYRPALQSGTLTPIARSAPATPRIVNLGPGAKAPLASPIVPNAPVTDTPSAPSTSVAPTPAPVPAPSTSAPTTPSNADNLYSATPQGWAVKAVGGFGRGIAGGQVIGPWNTTLGQGVRIAVLDSGVDTSHPDIAPNLAFNFSEVDQSQQPSVCDDGSPQDQQGHGTWVASLVAGALGTGTGRIVGVAPSATLLNIKVLQRIPGIGTTPAAQCAAGEASGLVSWLLKGIDDAMAQHADIIVLSLGSIVDLYTGDGAGLKASFDRVTHTAFAAGIIIVAAAGNDGFDLANPRYLSLPAQARDVLAIMASTNPDCAENTRTGATCAAGPVTVPYYSNFGASLNAIAAPGGSYPDGADEAVSGWVRGACSSGKPGTQDGLPAGGNTSMGCFNLGHQPYVQAMGTSASTPLVAGVAALVKAAHPGWSAATLIAALRGSARATPHMPVGLVDAAAAMAWTQ